MQWRTLVKAVWFFVFLGIFILGGYALAEYPGSAWVYLLFTLLSSAVLFFGFGRGALFFDAFIGVLLWIGFWLKFSVRVAFSEGVFNISVGGFDGSPAQYDTVLLVVSCALAAILLARFIRSRCFFNYPDALPVNGFPGLYGFYVRYRLWVLAAFLVGVLVVAISNVIFGFYQRGLVAKTVLPFGLNGVYAWLLSFGLAACSALLLRFEFERNKDRYWAVVTISLLETLVSNVSLLSRGMILNAGSLIYGGASIFSRVELRLRWGLAAFVLVLFCVFFVVSVVGVNTIRAGIFYTEAHRETLGTEQVVSEQTARLFIDRWVGVEGVMSVVGAPQTGWGVFKSGLGEEFDKEKNSYYDENFIKSPYDNARGDGHHFISLPGYVAFLFYPASYLFLFAAVFAFSAIAYAIEYFVYRLGGRNLVLCALIAQVVAFRYTSFGYVPLQSYMLFGSIVANVLIFYCADRLLQCWYKPRI
jgi:hypothetical protein